MQKMTIVTTSGEIIQLLCDGFREHDKTVRLIIKNAVVGIFNNIQGYYIEPASNEQL